MMRIIGDAGFVVLPAALIYLGLLIFSFITFPTQNVRPIDTSKANETFLSVSPAYLTYNSTAFADPKPIMVMIGPSNVQLGFPLQFLQDLMPQVSIHNATIGGARIDGMAAVVDLVYSQRPKSMYQKTIFVFGIWWGEFLHSGRNRLASPVAQQMGRFGLFRKDSEGYKAVLEPALFRFVVDMLRPFFIARGLVRSDGPLFSAIRGEVVKLPDTIVGKWVCDGDVAEQVSRAEKRNFARVRPDQFIELLEVATEIRRRGGQLVLVDLPQAKCSKEISVYWQKYQQIKHKYLYEAVSLGAHHLDLGHLNADIYFADVTHPTPEGAKAWSRALSKYIKKAIIVDSE